MTRLLLVLSLLALPAANAGAQSVVPEVAVAAEGEGRWADALQMYRELLPQNQGSEELWLRIADIEARLGHTEKSIEALQGAATAAPGDARILARLSRAYAAQGHAIPALRAIEAALALEPGSEEHLRAHATLATWAGEYGAAASSYRKLRDIHPNDQAVMLGLARVSAWDGSSDAAASAYREYLKVADHAAEAWLELARNESWRGNSVGALAALREYAARFGETPAYTRERGAVLARGGRPREALRELQPLLKASPADFDLHLSRTIALASARQHGAALSSLTENDALRPGHPDTRAAESLVRAMLGSNVGPSSTIYSDSDGLQIVAVKPRFDVGFRTDTRVSGGYEHIELQARTGSGLEQVSGARSATVEHVWAGLSQRLGVLTVGGTIGEARPEAHRQTTYAAFVNFMPTDSFAASVERSSGFAAISPRSAGLGLTRSSHKASLGWTPAGRYHFALEGSHEELSDGNARWEVFASPRMIVTRSQRLNLDAGLVLHQFGARANLDNGYYDPRRYEYYSVVLSPYWKVSDNVGIAMSGGIGGQRDEASRRFRLGTNASVEASFGIYERWLLKVHGSSTNNRRLDSGAFRGVSGGAVLLRRF